MVQWRSPHSRRHFSARAMLSGCASRFYPVRYIAPSTHRCGMDYRPGQARSRQVEHCTSGAGLRSLRNAEIRNSDFRGGLQVVAENTFKSRRQKLPQLRRALKIFNASVTYPSPSLFVLSPVEGPTSNPILRIIQSSPDRLADLTGCDSCLAILPYFSELPRVHTECEDKVPNRNFRGFVDCNALPNNAIGNLARLKKDRTKLCQLRHAILPRSHAVTMPTSFSATARCPANARSARSGASLATYTIPGEIAKASSRSSGRRKSRTRRRRL